MTLGSPKRNNIIRWPHPESEQAILLSPYQRVVASLGFDLSRKVRQADLNRGKRIQAA